MIRFALIVLVLLFLAPSPIAQNTLCATRPSGDSSNACASTAFVGAAVSAAVSGAITTTQAPTIPIIAPSSVGAPSATGSGCNPTAGSGAVLHHIPFTDQNWCTLFNLWSMSSIEPSAAAVFTVSGSPTNGAIITMIFKHLRGPTVTCTVTYTTQPADTNALIAAGLIAAIQANTTCYTMPSGGYGSGAIMSYVPNLGGGAFAFDYDSRYELTWQYTLSAGTTAITANAGMYAGPYFIGGTSTGSANSQTVAAPSGWGNASTVGQSVQWTAGFSNSGSLGLTIGTVGFTAQKYDSTGTLVNLVMGDVVAGQNYTVAINETCGCWALDRNSTPLVATSATGVDHILPNSWDNTFVVQPDRVSGSTSVSPQVSGAAAPGSTLWGLSPACQNINGTSTIYGNITCAQILLISPQAGLTPGHGGNWMFSSGDTGLWIFGNGIFYGGGCAYVFLAGCTLQDTGAGTINAVTYWASNLAGLSTTKTVRASGGASDCTLIFTGGLLTGGSC